MRILLAIMLLIASSPLEMLKGAEEISWRDSGTGGAVASGREEAVAAGLTLLKQGGNAADAAAATLLALAVTDYGLFAMGGEVPLLIYDARKREVKVLCGLGRAPLDQEAIKWYYENGIPSRGDMKSAPTPGDLPCPAGPAGWDTGKDDCDGKQCPHGILSLYRAIVRSAM